VNTLNEMMNQSKHWDTPLRLFDIVCQPPPTTNLCWANLTARWQLSGPPIQTWNTFHLPSAHIVGRSHLISFTPSVQEVNHLLQYVGTGTYRAHCIPFGNSLHSAHPISNPSLFTMMSEISSSLNGEVSSHLSRFPPKLHAISFKH
jgi:hypothetical protein